MLRWLKQTIERTVCPWCVCQAREHATPGWKPPMLGRAQLCEMHLTRIVESHHGATPQETADLISHAIAGWYDYARRTCVGVW